MNLDATLKLVGFEDYRSSSLLAAYIQLTKSLERVFDSENLHEHTHLLGNSRMRTFIYTFLSLTLNMNKIFLFSLV